jgi:hypothetical protein
MIRRGFWLLAGAVLGVTGYRKATRLARTLTGQGLLGGPAGPAAAQQRRAVRLPPAHAALTGRSEPRLALPGQPAAGQPHPGAAARIAAAAARAAAAAGFVRDVRDGMAEYWDLHRSESDRTLVSQRDQTWSGDSQQGARER